MKRFLSVLIISLALAAGMFAQIGQPAPKPTSTPDNDVVKISTNLIQIDVSVTDAKGKAITDLKADEIEIYENGEKQSITNFSFIPSTRTVTEKPKTEVKNAIPVPQAVLRPEQIRRTMALVVDDLTLSFESAYQTRRSLKKFVDEQMQDGDLVAIVRTGAGIGALQQFTSDKRMLYAAIEKVKWNPLGNGGISAFAPLNSRMPTDPDAPEPGPGERTDEGIEREFNDFRESYFVTGTLGALNYVIRGMAELPGRKSVILFSDGFAMFNVNAQGFSEASTIMDPLKRLIEIANRSSVVIYALDPRGLIFTGISAADNTSGRTLAELETEMAGRRAQLSDTQDSLRYLSKETGGFAVINNNDLSGGVRKVLDDQSYYLVAYEPDSDTFDAVKRRFNKLEVKVIRKGVTVRYRSGFFNVADKERSNAPAANKTPYQQLTSALASPFAVNGIALRLNALFGYDAVRGSYVRSLLHIDAKDLKFTDQPDGTKQAVVEILATSFGDNGQQIDQRARSYTMSVPEQIYRKILVDGFVYHFAFPVKKAGAYQYRVAIRDSQGDKIGSASQFIQVPDIKKNRLTVSSLILESLTAAQWQASSNVSTRSVGADPMADTALRRVRAGSVLRYGFEVYNAKLSAAKQPLLTMQVRVFRDGKMLLEGGQQPLDTAGQTELKQIKAAGAVALGDQITAGDYILQVIVTDNSAKQNRRIATQFVQFEVVE